MKTRVFKKSNRLWFRILAAMAKAVGTSADTLMQARVSGNFLLLTPVRNEYRLEKLVSKINSGNRHPETDWGTPSGAERW